MQGPTLTMSPALNDNAAFPRSHSSPNIPDLINFDFKQPPIQDDELPRSASFTSLPTLDLQYNSEKELQKYVTADVPVEPSTDSQTGNVHNGKGGNKLQKEDRPKLERVGRRKSLVSRPKSWIQKVKGGSPERRSSSDLIDTTPADAPPVPPISKAVRDSKTKTVSESFATFARKSWMTSSRSPSPNRNIGKTKDNDGQSESESKMTGSPITSSQSVVPPSKLESSPTKLSDSSKKSKKLSITPQMLKSRPQSILMNFTTLKSANSSTSSLPGSSTDERSTPRTSTDKVPPLPKNFSTEKLQNLTVDLPPRRRDELWSAFRSLENDYSKFQAKSWSLKTNVVRASLLPFLRNHASHPSNKNLRPEDLDRRITILNKWWTGLLEVLDGRQNQTVSGVDRPILLEACYAIMTRPEWRLAPSHFAPLSERSPNRSPERRPPMSRKKSSGSLSSSASQFMTESVYHNTRNLFIQNLLSQMSFVVDKMSLRHAPASLVTFCGKAAAYAFFFVPGVAEVMVRIWKLQAEVLRRVADELGMPRRPNKVDQDEVIAPFPNHMHCLGWSSVKQMSNQLRRDPHLAVLASKINWYGPWVARWCGRDSDLFFVFAKHYHVLAEEFMPAELPIREKARAPGFILVQAQILTALDGTIHRQPAAEPPPITFDDVLAGADASAAALPMPSSNSARPMAENRLIMLLRDFISERPSDYENARLTFAETFGKMMQAAAKRTSLFDHNACFVLCDFMEEALTIFVRFHHAHALEDDFIDWYFWMDVCRKMLESENSMSEIRLFSFLFGAWNVITNDPKRKEVLCLEWLLTEDTFDKFFNHWCPMVRAYYMRLLVWRLCRDDGEGSDLDTKIYCAVSTRVKSVWANYLFLKQHAEKARILPPSTAPCYPAPGRRLLIIRNDNQSPAANLFLGFDGIVNASGTTQASAYKRHSSLSGLAKLNTAETSSPKPTSDLPTTAPNKKRWTFMGKMLPSAMTPTQETASPTEQPRVSSPTKTLEDARRETAISRSRPTLHSKSSSTDSETPPAISSHRAYCFKFSLEWARDFEKTPPQPQSQPARAGAERRICPPRLPSAAQAMLGAKVPGTSKEISAKDPGARGRTAKYAGRALAEWALVVGECNNFVERRRSEGVPGLKWVEVPTLGVEGFRRFGGGG
ncbi:DUF1765-domain-containing protein [Mollisia scopiformis]|uniref:DUF1765-domain-containing protein n=1 Tax=Mollisia scopiformis TaxID=149040 RepID=A0A132B799_MOLSC|nr:DUF1765-domain-containing protein [Mollisia scopiformis]KUJ07557.1 DUF1765-domain-containing protein [Mollisia scopiformis]